MKNTRIMKANLFEGALINKTEEERYEIAKNLRNHSIRTIKNAIEEVGENFDGELIVYLRTDMIVPYDIQRMLDENRIKKIVLLAPCDIPREGMKFLSKEEYEIAKKESTRLVNEGKGNELVDFSVNANGVISAETYYNDFLPGGVNDFIRYSDDINSKSEVLNSIDIPVLVVFGDIDECVLTQDITTVKNYLNNNIKKCNIQIIEGANHSYTNKYEELGNIIENNI